MANLWHGGCKYIPKHATHAQVYTDRHIHAHTGHRVTKAHSVEQISSHSVEVDKI